MSKRDKKNRFSTEATVNRGILLDFMKRAKKFSPQRDHGGHDEPEEYRRGRAIIDWLLFSEYRDYEPVLNVFHAVVFASNFGHKIPEWAVDQLDEAALELFLDPTISLDRAFGRKALSKGSRDKKKLAAEVWMFITMYEQDTDLKRIDAFTAAEDEFKLSHNTVTKYFNSIEDKVTGELLQGIVSRLSKYPDIFNPSLP